ncbi:hypothetical protein [Alistipes sp.]|uniref:hypothetical protein n=1 Tax=Alistipes sp. TaxID=1872444 RepID=UPI0023F02A7F|nr:hypothetical protein [Alistipes sp.]
MIAAFHSTLDKKQLTALTELFNGQRVFQPEVDTNTVTALFMCRLKEPLVVCNARTLCYIFHILSEERLITPIWQAVAAKNKCFVSLNGKPISRNTLSSAKYCAINSDSPYRAYLIKSYIGILKNTK